MKRTVIWVLTLLMILCLTTTAFASDKLVINENNVQEVLACAPTTYYLWVRAVSP
jgi:methionine-rich copper-binding protein CopC